MKHSLRKFLNLLANGASMETMQKNGTLEKTYKLEKDVGEAVKQIRIENGVAEQAVMTALGLTDVQEYISWENGQATLELTADNITALAKVLKIAVPDLAAKMVSADGPNPELGDPANPTGDNAPAGNETQPPDDGMSDPGQGNKSQSGKGGNGVTKAVVKTAVEPASAVIHRISIKDDVEPTSAADSKALKQKRRSELAKSILGLNASGISNVTKGGLISPTDFAPGGTLNPELGRELFNAVIDQSAFLQKVQAKPVGRVSAELLVADVSARKIQRQKPGWPSGEVGSQTVNKSLAVNCRKNNLYLLIPDEVQMNYQSNLPGLEAELLAMFSMQFSNDLVDLGFNGSADTNSATETTFTNLNEGWNYLAQNGNGLYTIPAGQLLTAATNNAMYDNGNHSTGNFKRQLMYDALIDAGLNTNPRFFDDTVPIITGTGDWRGFEKEMGQRTYDSIRAIVDGVEKKFEGRPVEPVNYIVTQNAIQTKLANFVFAMVTGSQGNTGITVQRLVVPQGLLIIFTIWCDYEFVNYDAISAVKPS
jgi:transcriptional regulator with XRE-family HTH domain